MTSVQQEPRTIPVRNKIYNALAVILCVFVLVAVNTNLFDSQPNLALFGMLGLICVFLSKPACKWCPDNRLLKLVDIVLIVATIVSFGYVFVQSERMLESFWVDGTMLGDRVGTETQTDFIISLVGLLLVLEATRRAIGWTLPILCGLFIAYALLGDGSFTIPDWLMHRGFSWQQVVQKSFLQTGGVFGIALRVMFYYVFLFVLFGTLLPVSAALRRSGAADLIAGQLATLFQGVPAAWLVALTLVAALLAAPVVNGAVTALLLGPVAAGLAARLGVRADPFLMAVAVGASCDFLKPVGSRADLLALGVERNAARPPRRLASALMLVVAAVGTAADGAAAGAPGER